MVHHALWQKAQRCTDITLLAPVELQRAAWGESEAFLSLQDDNMSIARSVVDAGGTNSWLHNKTDIPLTFQGYRHHVLVATIRTARPHQTAARQTFHDEGTLTFLSLNNPHLCPVVWLLSSTETKRMQKADETTFDQVLGIAFDNGLGLCQLASKREVFPLTGRYARQLAVRHPTLIGDTAHTIHPPARQGMNLDLTDIVELIDELRHLHTQERDIGQHLYLRHYKCNRKHSAALMLTSMQGFRKTFSGSHPAEKSLHDIGLKLADSPPGVKPQLIRQAMDLNNFPIWLR